MMDEGQDFNHKLLANKPPEGMNWPRTASVLPRPGQIILNKNVSVRVYGAKLGEFVQFINIICQ
jgi:hypothetical protein